MRLCRGCTSGSSGLSTRSGGGSVHILDAQEAGTPEKVPEMVTELKADVTELKAEVAELKTKVAGLITVAEKAEEARTIDAQRER